MDNENQFDLLQMVLNQIKIDDPGIKQLIKQQISDNQSKGNQKEIKETIRRLRIQVKKLMEQVASLREQLRNNITDRDHIIDKLNDLVRLNKALAEALGSCNKCWGEDPECIDCSGEGVPGWRKINKRMFNL